MTDRPVHSSSLLAGDTFLKYDGSLGLEDKTRPHPCHVPRHAEDREEIQATMHNISPFFFLKKKRKVNNTCNDLAASSFLLLIGTGDF